MLHALFRTLARLLTPAQAARADPRSATDRIVTELDLGARAAQDAGAADAAAARRITIGLVTDRILAERQRAAAGLAGRIAPIATEIRTLETADTEPELETIVARFRRVDTATILRQAGEALREAEIEIHQALLALVRFRRAKGVLRPARQPSGWAVTALVLVLVIAGEAAANGLFLRDASGWGPAGGMLAAAGFATANVIASMALGHLVLRPLLGGAGGFRRLAALSGLAVGSALILAGHVLFVSFRDAAGQVGLADASHMAIEYLLRDPLHWAQDVSSLALLGIGLAASLLSAAKGIRAFDDRLPGYLEISRRHEAARAAREAVIGAAQDAIDAALSGAIETIDAVEGDLIERLGRLERLSVDLDGLSQSERTGPEADARLLAAAIAHYDDEVSAIRTEIPGLPPVAREPLPSLPPTGPSPIPLLGYRVERLMRMIEERLQGGAGTRAREELDRAALDAHAGLAALVGEPGSMGPPPAGASTDDAAANPPEPEAPEAHDPIRVFAATGS